jgi:DeoR family myo-inositol catabolism operon transcriptional repressor
MLDLEDYIMTHKTVSLDKLCEVFNVSKNTIRRDLNELTQKRVIKKVYGGVSVNEESSLVPFDERNIKNINLKSTIGQLSSNFINDGDIIFLDSGTTTLAVVEHLRNKQNVTILTNNLEIILKSLNLPNLNIIALPGNLVRETNSFVGIDTLSILKKYNINKSFMASTGISIQSGITNSYPLESEVKRLAMEKGLQVFLLVDSSKFDSSSLITYGQLKDIDYLITDTSPSKKYIDFCEENSIDLITIND